MEKTCSVEGCCGTVLALGWCRKHYLRHYKYGDVNHVSDRRDYIPRGENSPRFKHGLWDHPLYKTWRNMLARCHEEKDRAYGRYGARGILVCPEWRDIRNFIADMGARPAGTSLERVDNEKGYSKENCVWASDTAQNRNKRSNKMSLERAEAMRARRTQGAKRKELAAEFGVSEATVKKVLSGAYWK